MDSQIFVKDQFIVGPRKKQFKQVNMGDVMQLLGHDR